MYRLIRPLLFSLPPEAAHSVSLAALHYSRLLSKGGLVPPIVAPRRCMGLEFNNPIGLAAGLDKNGDHVDDLGSLGFGFIEVGTVTPKAQLGNPTPRLFRLPKSEAIINRMGFNNKGVDYLVEQVSTRQYQGILGINIGKNKDTPAEDALADYCYCLRRCYPQADYITVNISSPNTPGLRELQKTDSLNALLEGLMRARSEMAEKYGRVVPLLVKIAPDVSPQAIADMWSSFNELKVDGVIATNTTVDKTLVENEPHGAQDGGLSGRPLRASADKVLRICKQHKSKDCALLGVGGVMWPEDALQKLSAGADLVQIYSGLIYRGPGLVGDCLEALA